MATKGFDILGQHAPLATL